MYRCGLKNGHPWIWTRSSKGQDWDKRQELVSDMPKDKQQIVLAWIKSELKPRKTPNTNHSSYSLKHVFERDTGIYMTNNQFKDAMLLCGYYPEDETELNWEYSLSQKSPALVRDKKYNYAHAGSNYSVLLPNGFSVCKGVRPYWQDANKEESHD